MSQPTVSRPPVSLPRSPEAEEAPGGSEEHLVDSFFSEPIDLRARVSEAAEVPSSPAAAQLTYEPFYDLKEKAFSLSTDPRFLYKSGSHASIFHDLLAAIRRREGLIVLTGDIGTGKTTLCRAVVGDLDCKTFTTFVPDPFVSREDLLKMLLVEFGVVSIDDVRRGRLKGASRVELSYPLYEFLRSLGPLDAFAVLVIDEAQNLALPLLEEIRILGDLEDGRKLLQVVLVGQPEFRDHLKLPRMRQVDQRVSLRCELQPLTREGMSNYVAHRLSIAGGSSDRVAFAPASLDKIFEASGGIPRVINLICDRALEHGYRNRASSISPDLVASAVRDLQLDGSPRVGSVEESVAPPLIESVAATQSAIEPTLQSRLPAARPTPQPTSAHGPRGLFEKQTAATETTTRVSELDVLLDLPPTPVQTSGAIVLATNTSEFEDASNLLGAKMSLKSGEDVRRSRTPRFRLLTTMALAVIGVVSGVSLVGYFLWMRPLLTERPTLPRVSRTTQVEAPRAEVAAPSKPDSPTATSTKAVTPETSVATSQAKAGWAVQVAAFVSVSRTTALVKRLSEAGFPAYEGEPSGPQGFRLVLVGPYRSTQEAESIRDRIRQIPDLKGALLRNLETGENY